MKLLKGIVSKFGLFYPIPCIELNFYRGWDDNDNISPYKNKLGILIAFLFWSKRFDFKFSNGARPFHLSIKKKENCLFSRRNGFKGKIVFGYSIVLTIYGKVII